MQASVCQTTGFVTLLLGILKPSLELLAVEQNQQTFTFQLAGQLTSEADPFPSPQSHSPSHTRNGCCGLKRI
jgi:hypothetical protein